MLTIKALAGNRINGDVYCPICTHTVPAEVDLRGKKPRVTPGQRCPRCSSSLDVAVIVQLPEAA